jgi:hypothetical protein
MRLIIPAAGKGLRFRHYHHKRVHFEKHWTKHFAELAGETIIGRLVRLFSERGVDDIWVVGPDDRYRIDGAKLFIPTQVPEHYDSNKILNSSSLWKGRTVVFYGDVWLTDEGADRVVAEDREWVAFGRWGDHQCTGATSELFGFKFGPDSFEENKRILVANAGMVRRKELNRCAGWEFYWGRHGDPRKWEIYPETWCQIDDMTDDIDTPEQYEAMVRCVGRS